MPGPIFVSPLSPGLPDTPYLTIAEYKADPDSVDYSQLVPGGTNTQQDDALFQKIIQASSWVDSFCHFTLAATINTETARSRVQNDGYVRVFTRGVPILEIESFQIGLYPSALASISTAAAADIIVDGNVIAVPAIYASGQATSAYGIGSRVWCKYVYVNGYPNTLLANAPAQAATSFVVQSALGIYPGSQLFIYEGGKTEIVTVAGSYVGGVGISSTTIPITSGLLYAHTLGSSVSQLPALVKKASILATSAFIKTRGGGALQMDAIDQAPGKAMSGESGGEEDLKVAGRLLKSLRIPMFAT